MPSTALHGGHLSPFTEKDADVEPMVGQLVDSVPLSSPELSDIHGLDFLHDVRVQVQQAVDPVHTCNSPP